MPHLSCSDSEALLYQASHHTPPHPTSPFWFQAIPWLRLRSPPCHTCFINTLGSHPSLAQCWPCGMAGNKARSLISSKGIGGGGRGEVGTFSTEEQSGLWKASWRMSHTDWASRTNRNWEAGA